MFRQPKSKVHAWFKSLSHLLAKYPKTSTTSIPVSIKGLMPFTKADSGSATNNVVFNKSAAIITIDVFMIWSF